MGADDVMRRALGEEFIKLGVSEVRIAAMSQRVLASITQHGYYIAPIAQPTSPGARSTDPRTSHKAVPGVMRRNSQRHRLLQSYATAAAERQGGLTDEQAMEEATGVYPYSEYATRCSELRNAGWIEDTGEDRKGQTGTPRIVCRITEAGLAELRRLA